MKSVLIIGTGGTISMKIGVAGTLVPSDSLDELLSVYPELKKLANLEFYKLMNIDSSNMQPQNWIKIAEHIHENYNAYDGFIVTHGTDTMAYTASALSFALQNNYKPIVVTGAMKAPQEKGSDAKKNLFNSVMVASSDMADVCICFDDKLYRGNRAKKVKNEASKITNETMSTYSSVNYPLLGEIRAGKLILNEKYPTETNQLTLETNIDTAVASLKLFPGFNPKLLDAISKNFHGVVIEAFGPGNAPFLESGLLEEIEKTIKKDVE